MILVDLALDKQKNSTRYARSVDLKIDWSKKNCERPGDRVAMVLATVAGSHVVYASFRFVTPRVGSGATSF